MSVVDVHSKPQGFQYRVLVVDDDLDLAAVICDVLNGMGRFRAEHVGDGDAALAAWRRQPYDLLILDYQMPGMDGLQFLSFLRGSDDFPGFTIMISGMPIGEVALRSGASAFLAKPFPMNRLLETIATVLGLDH